LDDLTDDQILFVVAGKGTHGVSEFREPVAYGAEQIEIESRFEAGWRGSFLRRMPGSRYGGAMERPPESRRSFKAAITSATSDAARYFGIPEKHLPCIVILQTLAESGLVVSVRGADPSFRIYAYLQSLVIDFQPTLDAIRQKKEQIADIEQDTNRLKHDLGHLKSASDNWAEQWKVQRDSVTKWLDQATASSVYGVHAQRLRDWLNSTEGYPLDSEMVKELLEAMARSNDQMLVLQRLKKKLPLAFTRRASLKDPSSLQPVLDKIAALERASNTATDELRHLRADASFFEAAKKSALASGFVEDATASRRTPSNYSHWRFSFFVCPQPGPFGDAEYDVAISYAGEDKAIAQLIAAKLRDAGVSVFYAGFETARLWGKNLYDYLSDLFSKRARYSVLLLSEQYNKKLWTRLERQAAQAAIFHGREDAVLPVRLDDSVESGFLPTIGYLDLRQVGIDGVVSAIVQKLRH